MVENLCGRDYYYIHELKDNIQYIDNNEDSIENCEEFDKTLTKVDDRADRIKQSQRNAEHVKKMFEMEEKLKTKIYYK